MSLLSPPDPSLHPPPPAVVTADHVCMRQGLAPLLCSSPSSAKPCLPATPQQATPAASAFLGAGGSLVLLSFMSQLPRLICSAQSRVAFPAFALCGRGGGGDDSSAPPVTKQGRQLSLVPASGWGSRGSRQPRASRCPDGVQSTPPAPPPSVTCRPSDRTTSSAQLQPSCAGPFPAGLVLGLGRPAPSCAEAHVPPLRDLPCPTCQPGVARPEG